MHECFKGSSCVNDVVGVVVVTRTDLERTTTCSNVEVIRSASWWSLAKKEG